MLKNMKISAKILVLVLVITLGTLVAVSAMSYIQLLDTTTYLSSENANLGLTAAAQSKKALLDQSQEYMMKIGTSQADSTNKSLAGIRNKVTEMAAYVTSLYQNSDNFDGRELPLPDETEMGVASSKYMLAPGVEMTDQLHRELLLVSNAEYGFGPVLLNDSMLDNVYLGTETGISYRFSRSNAYNKEYDPRARGWYAAAKENQTQAVWLDTYTDSYGSVCISCAQAFFDRNGKFAGVVAMDITLKKVVDEIMDIKIGSSGFAFILDRNGEFIAYPEQSRVDDGSTLASLLDDEDTGCEYVMSTDSGMTELTIEGVKSYLAFTTLPETGWKICISIDMAEIVQPANDTKADIDAATDAAQMKIQKTLTSAITRYVIMFAAIGILVIVLSFAISGTISRPILRLVDTAREIGGGKLDVKVPVDSNDEVGELAKTFNAMTENLQNHISQLTTVTADKKRIETELNVATEIQASTLPCIFPAFPELPEFDIHATMDPAKEVGGDFYDFFRIDDNHIGLVIADVSGKGVPAALFMMISKTLLKSAVQNGLSAGEALERVNNQLYENNDADMFVTVWLGILDVSTGSLTCANAGHEFPAVKHKGGQYELFKDPHGLVCACMENTKYKEYQIQLNPGDTLFVYTDGVAEATDAHNELYGTDRLLDVLNRLPEMSCRELLQQVRDDINAFVAEAPQFDDITMLALHIREKK